MKLRITWDEDRKELAILGGVIICLFAVFAVGAFYNPAPKHTVVVMHNKPPAEKPYLFPQGGRTLFPAYRLVALYGAIDTPELGALGEQPMDASIERAKDLAVFYQPYSVEHVLPTLDIIATVASASPTENGDYSREIDPAKIQPWITAARAAGEYVVLELQPGRSDFLSQAKQYESLLKQPNVGLALDPEWRLAPDQVPLKQIGSVNITEVNQTVSWLADLTVANGLPQKLFLLHQFRPDMIANREQLDMSRTKQLDYVLQMDGSGTQPTKLATWTTLMANAPVGLRFGWKNFYKVDSPMLDIVGTMMLTPKPWYISYQ